MSGTRQTLPPLQTSKGWGTRVKSKAFGSEFIEWYHPQRGKVNCGKYGFERRGHPPQLILAHPILVRLIQVNPVKIKVLRLQLSPPIPTFQQRYPLSIWLPRH